MVGGGEVEIEVDLEEADSSSGRPSSRPRRRGGRWRRKARATSCGLAVPKMSERTPVRDVLALVGQAVQVGQVSLPASTCFSISAA